VKLIWTRSTLLGGKDDLITWGLDEPVSHFAILFDNDKIYHSSFHGSKVEDKIEVLKNRKVIYDIDIPLTGELEDITFNSVSVLKNRYDFLFFFWLVWRGVLFKFLNIKIPDKIGFQNPNETLCTEVLEQLPSNIKDKYFNNYNPKKAVTPYKLYKMIERGN